VAAQRTGIGRENALRRGRELVATVEENCAAPPEVVYDVLADLRTHALWGGEQQHANTRIVSIDAPEAPARVGTEFETQGLDPMGRFRDRSVVTEASKPSAFEFVTEARLETKRGKLVDWTLVHRYELDPTDGGSRIAYRVTVARISELPGMLAVFKVPVLSRLAMKASTGVARRGVRNLARMAEERASAR
jgi:uncharacterized protein YndB with AHSA1/START domain